MASAETLEVGSASRRRAARIVLTGVATPRRFEWTPLYFKEVAIVGSNAFGIETLGRAPARDGVVLRAPARGALDVAADRHAPLPLARWREALLACRDQGRSGAVKVLFDFRAAPAKAPRGRRNRDRGSRADELAMAHAAKRPAGRPRIRAAAASATSHASRTSPRGCSRPPTRSAVLEHAVASLREGSGADRCYAFEIRAHRERAPGACCAPRRMRAGVAPLRDAPGRPGTIARPRGLDRARADLPLFGAVASCPAGRAGSLRGSGVTSLALLPIECEGRWWGTLGLEAIGSRVRFAEDDAALLKIAANAIGAGARARRARRPRCAPASSASAR